MSLESYMHDLLKLPKYHVDEEYLEIEEEYRQKFGHNVPTEILPPSISQDQIRDAMKKCLENDCDNIIELLNVELNTDYIY